MGKKSPERLFIFGWWYFQCYFIKKNSFITIINFLKKFMDIKIDDKKILNTVNSCNFDNLAKMEKAGGFSRG